MKSPTRHCLMRHFLLTALCIVPLPAASVVIRDVTIHPVTAPDIANGSVVITGSKIAAVGTNVQTPPDAQIIDGHGLQLYPGLINAATNVGLSEIEALRDSVDLDEIGPYNTIRSCVPRSLLIRPANTLR